MNQILPPDMDAIDRAFPDWSEEKREEARDAAQKLNAALPGQDATNSLIQIILAEQEGTELLKQKAQEEILKLLREKFGPKKFTARRFRSSDRLRKGKG